MSFLDRYEFEQIIDQDLASDCYDQQQTVNEEQQLASILINCLKYSTISCTVIK